MSHRQHHESLAKLLQKTHLYQVLPLRWARAVECAVHTVKDVYIVSRTKMCRLLFNDNFGTTVLIILLPLHSESGLRNAWIMWLKVDQREHGRRI